MYYNIGEKIKATAKVFCVIGIILSCIWGGMVWYNIVNIAAPYEEDTAMVLGLFRFILIAGLGSLLSWVGSFALYGFGELIISNKNIEHYCKLMSGSAGTTDESEVKVGEAWVCSNCGETQKSTSIYCNSCGKLKEIDKELEEN